jgi:hypothetical protein
MNYLLFVWKKTFLLYGRRQLNESFISSELRTAFAARKDLSFGESPLKVNIGIEFYFV